MKIIDFNSYYLCKIFKNKCNTFNEYNNVLNNTDIIIKFIYISNNRIKIDVDCEGFLYEDILNEDFIFFYNEELDIYILENILIMHSNGNKFNFYIKVLEIKC